MSKLGDQLLKIAQANPDIIIPHDGASVWEPTLGSTQPKPLIESEHHEQVKLFRWAEQNLDKHPVLRYMFAIPNGGHRHPATAGRMKAEGVKRGVPDIFLPHPRGHYCGLFIEMKVKSNKPSRLQREYIAYLLDEGYKVCVCYSCQEAIEKIQEYLCLD
jgi:hypothetical protein